MAKRKRHPPKKSKPAQRDAHTPLAEHKREGKRLSPPLATLPDLKSSSWHDDRLPEMLWATLLIGQMEREQALSVFRALAEYILKLPAGDKPYDVTHTGFSRLGEKDLEPLLKTIISSPGTREVLRPLLLFEDLPARSIWERLISQVPDRHDWNTLASCVASTLNHQSQEATDCRWVRVLCMMAAGKAKLPTEEFVREYVDYPHYGDMRKVRPSIRATELAFRNFLDDENAQPRIWASRFWQVCYQMTPCYPLGARRRDSSPEQGTTIDKVNELRSALVRHATDSISSTAPDAKHDIVFGISIYSLQILKETMGIGIASSILGRLSIRVIVEAYITLAYLKNVDDKDLWQKYRIYGAGQAKLSYLKLEATDDKRSYVDLDTLNSLANEDVWEEFLPIDLGHWEQTNLRQMSVDSGTKDVYDTYYPWPSAFVHSHWGAIRDTVYDYCGNPLHRLHRIPRDAPRHLPDVIPDACRLIDDILDIVDNCYPPFRGRLTTS